MRVFSGVLRSPGYRLCDNESFLSIERCCCCCCFWGTSCFRLCVALVVVAVSTLRLTRNFGLDFTRFCWGDRGLFTRGDGDGPRAEGDEADEVYCGDVVSLELLPLERVKGRIG